MQSVRNPTNLSVFLHTFFTVCRNLCAPEVSKTSFDQQEVAKFRFIACAEERRRVFLLVGMLEAIIGGIWQSIKVERSVYFKFIHREAWALYWHQHQYPVNRQAWMLNDYKIQRLYSNFEITPLRPRNESTWQPAIFRAGFDWSILFGDYVVNGDGRCAIGVESTGGNL